MTPFIYGPMGLYNNTTNCVELYMIKKVAIRGGGLTLALFTIYPTI